MRRRRSALLFLLAVIAIPVVIAAAPASESRGQGFGGVSYDLSADSSWLEGCIVGPCLCPVRLLDDLTGDFVLTEFPTLGPGPWRFFGVSDVRWTLRREGASIEIRGTGTYQSAAPVLDEHRLILDLEFDGVPIGTLDSGVVPGALAFPVVEISALTSGECFQEAVHLAASPVPVPEPSFGGLLPVGSMFLATLGTRRRRTPKLG